MKSLLLSGLFLLFCTPLQQPALAFPLRNQWDGAQYSQNAQLQAQWAEKFFFKTYHFSKHDTILDIGSGDGKITARIATQVPEGSVLGIDNSLSMLREANKNYARFSNLHFLHQDAQNAHFYTQYPEKFDVIVSFVTLHWVPNQTTVLQGINKSLKPKGKFYLKLCSKGGDPIQDIADMLAKGAYKAYFKKFQDPVTRYSAKEYQTLLAKANLKVLSIQDVQEQDTLQGKDDLLKQIKSWLPHYHYLKIQAPQRAEQFIQMVINTYILEYPASNEGIITLYDHYLEVIGEKA